MALKFNGTSDKVSHGDIQALDSATALTFTCWAYIVESGNVGSLGIAGKDGALAADMLTLFINGASASPARIVGVTDGASHVSYCTVGSLTLNTWQHIATVFDGSVSAGSRMGFYINGVSVGSAQDNAGTALADMGTKTFTVGFTAGFGSPATHVANVKMWNAKLTASEVLSEYQNYEPQKKDNLLLWAPYDDDGNFARDYSGNGNHGTVTGAVTSDLGTPTGMVYPPRVRLASRFSRRHSKIRRNNFQRFSGVLPRFM